MNLWRSREKNKICFARSNTLHLEQEKETQRNKIMVEETWKREDHFIPEKMRCLIRQQHEYTQRVLLLLLLMFSCCWLIIFCYSWWTYNISFKQNTSNDVDQKHLMCQADFCYSFDATEIISCCFSIVCLACVSLIILILMCMYIGCGIL